MTSLEWTAPPDAALNRQRTTLYTEISQQLRRRPQEWARLPNAGNRSAATAAGLAQNIRRGTMKDFPKGQFEAVNDKAEVYVRFVGEANDENDEGDGKVVVNGGAVVDTAVVRAWGKLNGFPDLPERGRLPDEVREAYARSRTQD